MAYWFIGKKDELLLDLDNYEKRVERYQIWGEMFRQRFRDAINAGKLAIHTTNGEADIFLAESNSPDHFHVFIKLALPMPLWERLNWQLRLASDWKRAHADLMRGARGIGHPSLLIRRDKVPGWREPDFECTCTGKHETLHQVALLKDGDGCPIWQKVRGPSPWELFGEPAHNGIEMPVNLPVGRVPLELILKVGQLKGETAA